MKMSYNLKSGLITAVVGIAYLGDGTLRRERYEWDKGSLAGRESVLYLFYLQISIAQIGILGKSLVDERL